MILLPTDFNFTILILRVKLYSTEVAIAYYNKMPESSREKHIRVDPAKMNKIMK